MSHEHIIILSKSQSFHFSAGLESPVQLGWSVNTADDKVLDLPIKNIEWLIITSNILRIVLTNVHNLDMLTLIWKKNLKIFHLLHIFSESMEIPVKLVDLSSWNPFQPALTLSLSDA